MAGEEGLRVGVTIDTEGVLILGGGFLAGEEVLIVGGGGSMYTFTELTDAVCRNVEVINERKKKRNKEKHRIQHAVKRWKRNKIRQDIIPCTTIQIRNNFRQNHHNKYRSLTKNT